MISQQARLLDIFGGLPYRLPSAWYFQRFIMLLMCFSLV